MAGGETRQPGAANMMELQWDEELARLAQAHADQCKFRSDFYRENLCFSLLNELIVSDTTARTVGEFAGSKLGRTSTSPSTPGRSGPTGGRPSTPGSTRSLSSRAQA